MPRSTHRYPFEWKVFKFVGKLSQSMTGEFRTVIMTFGPDGDVLTLSFEEPASGWDACVVQLAKEDRPHLFCDPFDAPEYTCVSWHKIHRSVMERIIGELFGDSDFEEGGTGSAPSSESTTVNTFPESWNVVF